MSKRTKAHKYNHKPYAIQAVAIDIEINYAQPENLSKITN